jgi:hypothetical protein
MTVTTTYEADPSNIPQTALVATLDTYDFYPRELSSAGIYIFVVVVVVVALVACASAVQQGSHAGMQFGYLQLQQGS